ncbi:MAG: DUF4857 domain-containing protein [Tannerella sp.]|nr:DUF4857 domain-containing protein [Tannerella sp.]
MYKKVIYPLLLIFVAIAALWGIPEIVRTATYSRSQYPFVYFSSVVKKFMMREFEPSKPKFHDDDGKEYTEDQYDKSLPLLNYRQLTVNGEMPDSIDGRAIDPRELRVKSINFRFLPAEIQTPTVPLYIMYESLPKKAKLESPGDVFRFKDYIQFVDDETNTINEPKSEMFQQALLKAGFVFPSQWIYGNINIRKPYDEGYFSLDADGKLFHIKMVNGKPFIRNTQLDAAIKPVYFSMLEVSDKRFYGFLFDRLGYVYILEEGGGKYVPLKLEIDPVNIDTDEITILGNMMYWTVSVQNADGKKFFALDAETLKRRRDMTLKPTENRWNLYASCLFPVYLTFKIKTSDYIAPRLHFTSSWALICNIITALIAAFALSAASTKQRIFAGLFALIFGIAGLLALLIIPNK